MAKQQKHTPKPIQKAPVESTPISNMPQIPIPLILAMGIVCCIYTVKVMDPVLIPKFWGYSGFVFGLFLWIWIKGKIGDLNELFNQYAILWVSAAYIGISGVLGIYGASMLGDALLEWGKWALGAFGMWAIVAYYRKNPNFRDLLCQTTTVFTLIACLFALSDFAKLVAANNLTHSTSYNINSLFGHKNILSEVLFLMLPFNLYAAFYQKNLARILAIAAVVISFIFMIGLLSRAIWITLLLSTFITGILYIIIEIVSKRQGAQQLKKLALYGGIGIVLVIVSLGLYAAISKGDAVQKQLASITNIQHSANQDRLKKWQQTWQLFEEAPLTGIGIGDWKVEILKFITKNSEVEQGKLFFQRPHNDYLWILSESGVFSFVAYLSIFGVAIYMVLRLIKQSEDVVSRNWFYLLLNGIIGYMIFSAFAFPRERIEEIFFLHLIFAAILYEYDKVYANATPKPSKPIAPIIAIIITAICIYVGYERFDGETELRKFETHNKEGKFDLAVQNAENAYRPMLEMDPISTPIRFFSGTLYLQMQKYPQAKQHLEEAHALSPYHVQVMNNLAGLYFMTKETEKSQKLYEKVLQYAPKYEDALLSLTAISYNSKKMDEAFYYICQLDTNSQNTRYQQYSATIVPQMKSTITSEVIEPPLQQQISNIFNQKIWYTAIPMRARMENRTIAKQVIAEAIVEMLRVKVVTIDEGEELRKKYLN